MTVIDYMVPGGTLPDYYEVPDREEVCCNMCKSFEPCPCGCGWGICTNDGEWVDGDDYADECNGYEGICSQAVKGNR